MLRKEDIVLIVKTGHPTREVGHFDQGMGLVGPRKMGYKVITGKVEPKKREAKKGSGVRMSKIQGVLDAATGRMLYSKR